MLLDKWHCLRLGAWNILNYMLGSYVHFSTCINSFVWKLYQQIHIDLYSGDISSTDQSEPKVPGTDNSQPLDAGYWGDDADAGHPHTKECSRLHLPGWYWAVFLSVVCLSVSLFADCILWVCTYSCSLAGSVGLDRLQLKHDKCTIHVDYMMSRILAFAYSWYRAILAIDIDIRDISAGTLTSASGGPVRAACML